MVEVIHRGAANMAQKAREAAQKEKAKAEEAKKRKEAEGEKVKVHQIVKQEIDNQISKVNASVQRQKKTNTKNLNSA